MVFSVGVGLSPRRKIPHSAVMLSFLIVMWYFNRNTWNIILQNTDYLKLLMSSVSSDVNSIRLKIMLNWNMYHSATSLYIIALFFSFAVYFRFYALNYIFSVITEPIPVALHLFFHRFKACPRIMSDFDT